MTKSDEQWGKNYMQVKDYLLTAEIEELAEFVAGLTVGDIYPAKDRWRLSEEDENALAASGKPYFRKEDFVDDYEVTFMDAKEVAVFVRANFEFYAKLAFYSVMDEEIPFLPYELTSVWLWSNDVLDIEDFEVDEGEDAFLDAALGASYGYYLPATRKSDGVHGILFYKVKPGFDFSRGDESDAAEWDYPNRFIEEL